MRTKTPGLTAKAAVVLMIAAHPCFSQLTALNAGCDLAVLGATETKSFLAFDQELRNVLTKNNPDGMALLVKFPLRVNESRGSWYVTDPGALRLRFQKIFTPAIRDAVLNERPSTIECNWRGIRYGSGAVWVKPQIDSRATKAEATGTRYLVEAINPPSVYDSVKNQPTVTVDLVCQTDQQWVVVDDGANGKLRYRAWNKPHTLADKPDLIIAPGRKESQGAGPCSHSAWLFNAGQAELIVEGRGCNSDRIPEGAQATVQMSPGGKAAAPLWCF